ncbi:sporulation histidine kinase inhibitor Sda [Bacillus mesophilum]|nr:sporulation histidine kinase inhibitor Sda [Bacillus mesophilum]
MKSLNVLDNSVLIRSFKDAVSLKLDKRFIKLLQSEIIKRGLMKLKN